MEEVKVGDSERRKDRHSWGGTGARKGKIDYRAQNKQGIQPIYGKLKSEPDNGCKQGKLHKPSKVCV